MISQLDILEKEIAGEHLTKSTEYSLFTRHGDTGSLYSPLIIQQESRNLKASQSVININCYHRVQVQ